ncbi:hypothetical protein [Rhizobium sp. ERR 1071]|uniref:hypothetical protein n=1 Tax=Rhizobium sp. ERR 1071 TaxID=2572677 RepID=UPI00119E7824|nr:hypothetical protein [Rhizobium sp. ERR1071]
MKESEGGSGEDASTSLFGLKYAISSAHQDKDGARIVVKGQDGRVNNAMLTSFALLLHEFATNAIKYGSLSVNRGRVEIEVTYNDSVVLTWTEVVGPPARVSRRLGGLRIGA